MCYLFGLFLVWFFRISVLGELEVSRVVVVCDAWLVLVYAGGVFEDGSSMLNPVL